MFRRVLSPLCLQFDIFELVWAFQCCSSGLGFRIVRKRKLVATKKSSFAFSFWFSGLKIWEGWKLLDLLLRKIGVGCLGLMFSVLKFSVLFYQLRFLIKIHWDCSYMLVMRCCCLVFGMGCSSFCTEWNVYSESTWCLWRAIIICCSFLLKYVLIVVIINHELYCKKMVGVLI